LAKRHMGKMIRSVSCYALLAPEWTGPHRKRQLKA
jgi:hypothetical protein